MDESRGTKQTAQLLREAYMNFQTRGEFSKHCQGAFGMDEFMAQLIWEAIDAVVDLGVDT